MDTEIQLAGRDRLDTIVADELAGESIDQGPMFSTVGWRRGGKVFAFVGRSGELMVKLPEARVAELIGNDAGMPMTVGTRTMREWVRIPVDAEWASIVVEAHAFGAAAS